MDRRFIAILVAIVLIAGGVFWFARPNKASNTSSSSHAQPSNHVTGKGTKNVTLIEYGDYQCPACGAYYPVVKQLVAQYENDIFFQFRNFPLTQIHQNAFAGARAAEAADKQGKYWEMHDLLYEGQQDWGTSAAPLSFFDNYAKSLSLDMTKFHADYQSQAVNDVINADINEGKKIGANSTPTFVLEGKKIEENPRDVQSFSDLIQAEIDKKNPPANQ